MRTVKCFHQVFRPPPEIGELLLNQGFGNCRFCQPDPERNKDCRGYQPTTIEPLTFFVEQKKVIEAEVT